MSRTLRRNKKHLIDTHVGTREANQRNDWWMRYRYPSLTFEQAYERAVYRYTGDNHPGRYNVPRWFRRQWGSKVVRLHENHMLYVHRQKDSWEAHSPDSRCRGAAWRWW